MRVTITVNSRYDQNEAWISAAFDLFDLDAGTVQGFVGVDYREEVYDSKVDSLTTARQVGGSAGNSLDGTRDVSAAYFEFFLPLVEDFEITLAGRQDKYSDYGSDFSPKISARWQLMDNLTLRSSYGEGFRAPTLDLITQQDIVISPRIRDPQTCLNQGRPADCEIRPLGLRVASAHLDSEQSDQFSFGIVYEPFDWFNFTLDWYEIEISKRIKFFSGQDVLIAEIAGAPIPTGLSIERDTNGSISRVVYGFGNEGLVNVSGIDLNMVFNYELFGSQVRSNLQLGHLLSTSLDAGRELVGDPGKPADRLTISNSIDMGNFSAAYNLNLIGDQCSIVVAEVCSGHVPTWVTHDLQFNYFAPWGGKITIGVRNIGEKGPPINVGNTGSRDYDFNLYDAYGRITYLQYTQSF
jgi:iron complex outermembrane receptor protein